MGGSAFRSLENCYRSFRLAYGPAKVEKSSRATLTRAEARVDRRVVSGEVDASRSAKTRFTSCPPSSRSPSLRAHGESAPEAWARLIPPADPASGSKKAPRLLAVLCRQCGVFEITAGRYPVLLPPSAPGGAARERTLSAGAVFSLGPLAPGKRLSGVSLLPRAGKIGLSGYLFCEAVPAGFSSAIAAYFQVIYFRNRPQTIFDRYAQKAGSFGRC